jgi:hypothetical protein
MLKKAILLYNTVRYLKTSQLFYQLFYRLKPAKTSRRYATGAIPQARFLNFIHEIINTGMARTDLTFNFLNKVKKFDAAISWDYQAYGKLWNYNLQYFNFLHQPDLPQQTKLQWLTDIGNWLTAGKLKLEPYPVSLRVINTIRYLSVNKINDEAAINDVYAQLNYLSRNVEYHLLGNHLLENAFALTMGGGFFNKKSWYNRGKELIVKQLNEQILGDGAHFELSPMYHQIILFRVLELIDWYRNGDIKDPVFLIFVENKAVEMLSWLQFITFKNGDIPHFNDSSTGIAYNSTQLFEFAADLKLPVNRQPVLNGSGHRKFTASKYECVVDVSEIGPSYQPGHGHADALSFILYAYERPLLVEMGTSTYQPGDIRNRERSTRAHNTVEVADENQSDVWGSFRVANRAEVKILTDTSLVLSAMHDGYKKKLNAIHTRSFIFGENLIVVHDDVSAPAQLPCKAFFHFFPGYHIELNGERLLVDNVAEFCFEGANKLGLEYYQLANGFNKYLAAIYLIVDFSGDLKTTITFL